MGPASTALCLRGCFAFSHRARKSQFFPRNLRHKALRLGTNGLPQNSCGLSIYQLQVNKGPARVAAGVHLAACQPEAFRHSLLCSDHSSLAHPSVVSASCAAGPEASTAISCSHLVEMKEGQELRQQKSHEKRWQQWCQLGRLSLLEECSQSNVRQLAGWLAFFPLPAPSYKAHALCRSGRTVPAKLVAGTSSLTVVPLLDGPSRSCFWLFPSAWSGAQPMAAAPARSLGE